MLRVPVVCLWAGVNCDRPTTTNASTAWSSTLELQLRYSRPLGLCSRKGIHAEPIDSNRTLRRSDQFESIDTSKTSFKRARLEHDWRYVQNHHPSKFTVYITTPAVMTGLGVSTPPILLYTSNLVTSRQGHFYVPSELEADLTTSRQGNIPVMAMSAKRFVRH